ncbi:MAG TPA: FAD-dependent oxidoreductase [Pseudonocardiaceae bacterium]
MTSPRHEVLVIGAGVSGLTTTLALLESGVPSAGIRLIAEQLPAVTTSACAGAIWGPYLSSGDQDTDEWGQHTLERLHELAADPATGVRVVPGTEASRLDSEPPSWATKVEGFRRCAAADLPDGFVSGWRYAIPIVDMPRYLGHLVKHLGQTDVTVESGHFRSLADAATTAKVVVNCTGIEARTLVPDPSLTPVRGQLVVVENPGIEEFFAEHTEGVDDLTYLLPQGDHVVLGGSVHEGAGERHVDPEVGRGILERCVAVEPRLRGVRVLEHRVGIRPSRPRVRVERDDSWAVPVVHNYGHGGSGVSLSWGCARDVARLVTAALG